MSSNNNNDNIEQIYTGEETDSIPEYQELTNDTTHPQPTSSGFTFGSHPTGAIPGLGGGVAMGAFGRPPTTASSFGGFGQTPTTAAGLNNLFSRPPTGGAFSLPPTTTPTTGFGSLGGLQPTGMGCRVERHPETGQPIPMGCNLMPPQGVCGGIRNNNPNFLSGQRPNEPVILNAQPNKKKPIEDLYKKLANARAQIQALNKVIDEIYETLPNIN